MKKGVLLYIILLLVTSCSKEDMFSNSNSSTAKGVGAHLSLYTVPMKTGDVATRQGGAVVDDASITNIRVLQFSTTGDFIKNTFYNITDLDDVNIELVGGTTSNVYFIANCPEVFHANLKRFTGTEDAFKTLFSDVINTSGFFVSQGDKVSIPMLGSIIGQVVPASGFIADIRVILTRMLARVDLTYNVAPNSLGKFSLGIIEVCNIPKQLSYTPSTASIFPTISKDSEVKPIQVPLAMVNSTDPTTLIFYLPENRRGISAIPVNSPKLKTGIPYATYFNIKTSDFVMKLYPGADMMNDYNIERNKRYTINLTLYGSALSDQRITEIPKSNCYLVNAGDRLLIPISRANASLLGIQIPDITKPNCHASVYWTTTKTLVSILAGGSCSEGIIVVETKANTDGNAVVCIRDDNTNNILWSWHIWVTSKKQATITAGGYTFMDRNLGALDVAGPGKGFNVCAGLQYQLGRKDPFMPAIDFDGGVIPMVDSNLGTPLGTQVSTGGSDNTRILKSGASFASSVLSPITFFCDWDGCLSRGQEWGASDKKSIYDPCPVGWRVPRSHELEYKNVAGSVCDAHIGDNNLFSYVNMIANYGCYSVCGYRSKEGIPKSVGTEGRYWTSKLMNGSGGTTLSLYSRVDLTISNNEACNIRCVKE